MKSDSLADIIPPMAPTLDLTQFAGHTPGPWRTGAIATHITNGARIIADTQPARRNAGAEELANAELIAAAPALLALAREQEAQIARLQDALKRVALAETAKT
jgi:hypothetical protein